MHRFCTLSIKLGFPPLTLNELVWRRGVVVNTLVGLDQRSCSTSGRLPLGSLDGWLHRSRIQHLVV